MDNVEKLKAVINTMDQIMVPATFDNANKILGIHVTLNQVIEDLSNPKKEDGEANV